MPTNVDAVRTTGIYCRPDCSARPDPGNVEHYLLPAAAEAAGYRACLRCRPYRVEQPVGAIGPDLVCRAVQMVLDGALDDGTEDTLARRLGVSGRHLRRLFTDHLGATPDQLARSKRVHFARRLLDDTDLGVGEIAFAAGFGSVRQFNRACRDTFRAAPLELRARRRRADRLVADGGLDLRLPFTGPLDWPALAGWLAARATPGVESVDMAADGGPTYRRTVCVEGRAGVIELSPGRAPDAAGHLVMRAHLPHWEGLIHVVQRARRIAALDLDLAGATATLRRDFLLGPLLAARPGLRPPGAWDPFEVGVRAVLGQQVSVKAATTIAGRLVERIGTPVPGLTAFGLTHLFPEPAVVTEADLGGLGLTGARADALRGFAAAVVAGEVPLDRSVPLDELESRVTAVPGLGPWTAQYLALRMGEPDAFPSADLVLRRAATHLQGTSTSTGGDRSTDTVTARELAARAGPWRPWRAVAAVHLWAAAPGPRNQRC